MAKQQRIVVVLPCSGAKRKPGTGFVSAGTCPFMDIYIGPRWQQVRHYNMNDAVAALSAKYGLLMPNERIEPYDEALMDDKAAEMSKDRSQADRLATLSSNFDHVVVICSSVYRSVVEGWLQIRPLSNVLLCEGSIFEQERVLKDLLTHWAYYSDNPESLRELITTATKNRGKKVINSGFVGDTVARKKWPKKAVPKWQ